MELFGSLTSISGAFTASVFTGSFKGDGSGLYGIQASGVTGLNLSQIGFGANTASMDSTGFQINTDTSITGSLRVNGTIVAEQLDVTIYSSSVLFQSGSTRFGDSLDDNHNITGSVNITGSISLNGQAIGTGKLDETTFYSYTSSNDGRVSSLETSTSSLNSFTNSINTTIKNKLNTENVISGSIQVDLTGTTNYTSFSSSIATTDANQNSRLNAIEIMTNSLNNFSYSIDSIIKNKLNVENVVSTSAQITLSSVNGYSTFSSSLATINLNQDNRLSALETTTGSLNTFTSSALTRVSAIETSTGSLNTFSSSTNTRLNAIETSTSSLNTFTSSQNTFNTAHNTATASLNSFTSSQNTFNTAVNTATSSLNSFTSSINTTIDNRLNTKGVISGSSQILTNSNIVSSSAQVTAYGFATTGSNTFVGTENINGSLTVTGSIIVSSGSAVYNSSLNLTDTSSLTLNSGSSLYVYDTGIISGTFKGTVTGSLGINGNVSITGSIVASGTSLVSGSSQIDITSTTNYTTFSSSIATTDANQNTRLNAIETATASLNTLTASVSNRVNSLESTTSSLNSYTSSNTTNINAIHTATSSLNSFSSSINSYTSSNNTRLNTIESTTSSLNSYTSSNNTRLNTIESTTSSLNTFTSSANTRLGLIETSTGSLNTFSSSTNTRLNAIETSTGSLNSFTSSINTTIKNKLNSDGVLSGSIQVDITSTTGYSTFSSSLATTDANQDSKLTAIETSTSSLNSYTSSTNTRLNNIETSTGSLNSFTSSINTTIKNKLNSDGVISGSIQVSITGTTGYSTFSSSLATTDTNQDTRLSTIEGKTGSYATTGSNVFQGNQTITGSLFVSQNLIVGGSSSINFVSQSTLNIGTNLITVNAQNPGTRFGGLAVIDSGSSPTVSGSMLFDSINNQWIFVHQNQAAVTSSILLMGPQTFNNIGNESYPTTNRVLKSVNAEHVGDSNISDTGTKVSVNSNTEITGSLIVTGEISSSQSSGDEGGQINLSKAVTNTTLNTGVAIDVFRDKLRIFEQGGTNRGGYYDITSLGAGVATNLNVTSNVTALESTTASLNSYTSSNTTNINAIQTATSSLNSYTSSTNTRLGVIESTTASLNTYTSSNNTRLNGIETTTGSLNSYTSSNNSRLNTIESTTGSLNTFTSSANSRLNSLETASGSIRSDFNSYTSSANGRLTSIETSTGSINTFTSSASSRLTSIETSTGSLNSYTSSTNTRLGLIETSTGSLNSYTSSNNTRLGLIETATGSLNSYTSSNNTRLNTIELTTSSLNTFTSSTNTRLGLIETATGSINTFTSSTNTRLGLIETSTGSLNTFSSSANTRLNAIETSTGSLNTFTSSQNTFNTAHNTATASLNSFTSSTNTRLGLIETSTGSLNSFTNSINTTIDSRLNTKGVISGSSQVDFASISNKPALVSGSSQITFSGISGLPTLVSGSSQITYSGLSGVPSGIVSGSSQITFSGISGLPTLVSGSSQISYTGLSNVPSGIVSGSSQITLASTTGFGTYLDQAVKSGSTVTFAGISSTAAINIGSFDGQALKLQEGTATGNTYLRFYNSTGGTLGYLGSFNNSGTQYTLLDGSTTDVTINGQSNINLQTAGATRVQIGSGGILYSTYNTATGRTNNSFSVGKTVLGNIHIQNGGGPSNSANQAAITFQGGTSTESQAGIYVLNDNSNGTSMGFATTESYSTGPQLFMTATNGGVVNFPRAVPTYAGTSLVYNSGTWSISISGNAATATNATNATTASTVSLSSGTAITHTGSGNINLARWTGSGTPVPFTISAAGSTNSDSATYGTLLIDRSNITANGAGANFHFTLSGVEYGGMGVTAETGISSGATVGKMRWYLTTATNTNRQEKMTLDSSGHLYTYGNIGIQATPRGYYYSAANRYGINLGGYGDLWSLSNQSVYLGANVYYDNGWYRGPGATVGGWFEVCPSCPAFVFNGIASGTAGASASPFGLINVSMSNGSIIRQSAGFGYLDGKYGSAESGTSSHVIYTIGGSYQPTSSGLGNMYGIGYANAAGSGYALQMTNASGWGLYVASNGTPYAFIGSEGNASVFRSTILPHANNTYNLGSASYGWANVYTNDLHLSNMNKPEGNDIDGTNGNWTIQEGAENLYIINNNNGKKFKISLEEIK